jgi:hypothetical protein
MPRFHFRLERVRHWQLSVCAAEEEKLRDLLRTLAGWDQSLAALRAEFVAAEEGWRQVSILNTADLRAWGAFRLAIGRKERSLLAERLAAARAVEQQRAGLLRARKRLEAIEKLRERALREHQVGVDRELEEVALTAHLHDAKQRRALSPPA